MIENSTFPAVHGRGSSTNPPNRFERLHYDVDPDLPAEERPGPRTEFFYDGTKSILAYNDSPDVGFSVGINCYRGCEHGCAYCFARPFHEYLGWSCGLDFESRIVVKLDAPGLLRSELSSPRWVPEPVGMSGVTDCYQPAERRFKLTRSCLKVFAEFRNPVVVITKSHLVTRDVDVLAELARWSCVKVNITITTLDPELSGKLEPRAARPDHRLRAVRLLAEAGIPVGVLVAPVIPGLTDHEMPSILDAAASAGARSAGMVILRLPHSVKDVFSTWLDEHAPGKKERVLHRIRDMRGGKLNVSEWGARMKGEGPYAEQIHNLFEVAKRRAGMAMPAAPLSAAHFRTLGGQQLELDNLL